MDVLDIKGLVTNDLEFVRMMSDKYNLQVASWYARLASQETHEEWIARRVQLSLNSNEVIGIMLCSNSVNIVYTIPLHLQLSQETPVTLSIENNGIEETVTTSYDKLYQTLEYQAQVHLES